jgi:ribonuclease M5
MLPDYADSGSSGQRLHITRAIVVEGRYDKAALANVTDADIIELGGFRAYKDRELLNLIRRLANTCGVIVLTDSDRAGFQLRGYLKSAVTGDVQHAFIPDVFGKEKRKTAPSKEGKLGVEGVSAQTLRDALLPFAVNGALGNGTGNGKEQANDGYTSLTKADFFERGLSGGVGSAERRRALARSLDLPERLSADTLLAVINALHLTVDK